MIKFQALPKFTLICYALSVAIIGLVLAEQFLEWQLYNSSVRIKILIVAAIIGVAGSAVSIGKQLVGYLKGKG